MRLKRPLKRLAALLAATAVGLTAVAAVTAPAQATGSFKGGHGDQLNVTTDVWGEAECKAGEWHVTWYLKDTTETNRTYDHKTLTLGFKTDDDRPLEWHEPAFESGATLKSNTKVPRAGKGVLSGTQILAGDTAWVRFAAPTGWVATWSEWGVTSGVSDKLILGDCGREPSAATVTSSCTDFTVVLTVPQNGTTTDFTVTTAAGEQTHTLQPGETETVTVPIDYDRGSEDPHIEVTWPDGDTGLTLQDYDAECVGLAEVSLVADCIEFKIVLTVPENGITTDFTVTTAAGEQTHTVAPGDAPLEIFNLVEYDGATEPSVAVTWPEGEQTFTFEDYDAECIAYSDFTGTVWSDCDTVGYEFYNTAVQNGGVPVEVRLEPSEGEPVELTVEAEAYVEGTLPVTGDGFTVDIYLDGELDSTYTWAYDAEACDQPLPPTEETTTPVAGELTETGASLTVAVVGAAVVAAAGAVLFVFLRRRRAAENW